VVLDDKLYVIGGNQGGFVLNPAEGSIQADMASTTVEVYTPPTTFNQNSNDKTGTTQTVVVAIIFSAVVVVSVATMLGWRKMKNNQPNNETFQAT
jgi:hypothetical protein